MLDKLRIVRALIDGLEPHLAALQKGSTENANARREALSLANSAAREIQAIINALKPATAVKKPSSQRTGVNPPSDG